MGRQRPDSVTRALYAQATLVLVCAVAAAATFVLGDELVQTWTARAGVAKPPSFNQDAAQIGRKWRSDSSRRLQLARFAKWERIGFTRRHEKVRFLHRVLRFGRQVVKARL